ncbi:MAG: cytochrome b/b6 domain-containing protein [Roseovarius sp.]|nr:cytochrome b/b6 domain-containing protein [Roseovarius sp.]
MKTFKTWDPAIRVFHWSLVGAFTANALILDDDGKAHIWVGYAVVGLVMLRLLWGFIGPHTARFASFTPRLADVIGQVSDMATRRKRAHLGHSPLGALMIFNLLAAMLVIGLSGYMMTTNMFFGVEWVEELHEVVVFWAELSVVAHIAAVIWESRRTGVNLPRAMVTGVKSVPDDLNLLK